MDGRPQKRLKTVQLCPSLSKDTVQCVAIHTDVYTTIAMQQVCRLWKRAIDTCFDHWTTLADKMSLDQTDDVILWVKRYSLSGYKRQSTPLIFGHYHDDSFALDITSRLIRVFLSNGDAGMGEEPAIPVIRFKNLHPTQYLLPATANHKNGTICRVYYAGRIYLFYFERNVPMIFYKCDNVPFWNITSEALIIAQYKQMNST